MYSTAIMALCRCALELESRHTKSDIAQHYAIAIAAQASRVTDMACEHVAMSAEIHTEPQ